MPFGLPRRGAPKPAPAPAQTSAVPGSGRRGIPFDGLTEEWRLVGRMEVEGRLSDALNRRESIAISEVRWAPLDGSEEMTPAPGLERVDPFDLIAVFAGVGTLPAFTDAERAAHKLHKVPYDVALEVTPIHVVGTVYLFPGSEPDRLLDRSTELVRARHRRCGVAGEPAPQRSRRGRGSRQPVLPARYHPGRPAGRRRGPGAPRDPVQGGGLTVRSAPIPGGGRRGTRA